MGGAGLVFEGWYREQKISRLPNNVKDILVKHVNVLSVLSVMSARGENSEDKLIRRNEESFKRTKR